MGCHALEYNRTGPKHCGVLGRRAGSAPGYEYSHAMKRSKILWNERSLDRFLAAPTKVVPGTTMTYAGVPDAKDRADLIAYLKQESAASKCKSID
jgi:cytochrome c